MLGPQILRGEARGSSGAAIKLSRATCSSELLKYATMPLPDAACSLHDRKLRVGMALVLRAHGAHLTDNNHYKSIAGAASQTVQKRRNVRHTRSPNSPYWTSGPGMGVTIAANPIAKRGCLTWRASSRTCWSRWPCRKTQIASRSRRGSSIAATRSAGLRNTSARSAR